MVLGDGADCIKTHVHEHFPDTVKILEWTHLWATSAMQYVPSSRASVPLDAFVSREQYELLLLLLWQRERDKG